MTNEMKSIDHLGISNAPWHIGTRDEGYFFTLITSDTEEGKKVVATPNYHFECAKADANLIAAAPDLYQVAIEAVRHFCMSNKGYLCPKHCAWFNPETGACSAIDVDSPCPGKNGVRPLQKQTDT